VSPRPSLDPLASCAGKFRYEPNQAAIARKVAARTSRRNNAPLRAYRCLCCGGWHIGQPMSRRVLH
jgi:hypothetical protein